MEEVLSIVGAVTPRGNASDLDNPPLVLDAYKLGEEAEVMLEGCGAYSPGGRALRVRVE